MLPAPPLARHSFGDPDRILCILDELTRFGMQLIEELVADPRPALDKAGAFDRYSRSVRRSILLANVIMANRSAAAPPAPARASAPPTAPRETPAAPRAPPLSRDRLDRETLAADTAILRRPIPDAIQSIRRDLELEPAPAAIRAPSSTPSFAADIARRVADALPRPAPIPTAGTSLSTTRAEPGRRKPPW